MQRGEVWWADLPLPWGRRPVLLLSRDDAYDRLAAVIGAPLTTRIRRGPSMVLLDSVRDGVPAGSLVNLDSLQAVAIRDIDERIALLSPERMAQVEEAIHFALGMRR